MQGTAASMAAWPLRGASARSPNILLIMADQLRKDTLGCYGSPVIHSPNIDRIAAAGVRFERNIIQNPVCQPSRSSILTGRYPRSHRVWSACSRRAAAWACAVPRIRWRSCSIRFPARRSGWCR